MVLVKRLRYFMMISFLFGCAGGSRPAALFFDFRASLFRGDPSAELNSLIRCCSGAGDWPLPIGLTSGPELPEPPHLVMAIFYGDLLQNSWKY
jgi:hypothetical protein